MIRLALFNADAVNQDDTTDPLYRQLELLAWLNDAKDKAEMQLRATKEDFNLLFVDSADSAYTWRQITFAPSTLQLTSSSKYVTLPPDLLMLKRIRCITSGSEYIRFREVDLSSGEGKDAAEYGVQSTRDDEILYDVVGENTLYLPYPPTSTLDIELAYIARSRPLQIYSTGTITTVNGSASVSGGSTSWLAADLANNLELIVSADATAPKIVSQTTGGTWVDPSAQYYPVTSVDSDSGLTLSRAWASTDVTGYGYILATVPPIPAEHHMLIVDALVARMKLKAENKGSDTYFKLEKDGKTGMARDVTERQSDTVRTVEEYIAG
jgi:hypothetical protein